MADEDFGGGIPDLDALYERLIGVASGRVARFRWPDGSPDPEEFASGAIERCQKELAAGVEIKSVERYCIRVITGPHGSVYTKWRSEMRRVNAARIVPLEDVSGSTAESSEDDPAARLERRQDMRKAMELFERAARQTNMARWPGPVQAGFLEYSKLRLLLDCSGPKAYDRARSRHGTLMSRSCFDGAYQDLLGILEVVRDDASHGATAAPTPGDDGRDD